MQRTNLPNTEAQTKLLAFITPSFRVESLVICKTKPLLHKGCPAAERPGGHSWHFINKKPGPDFLEVRPGQSIWLLPSREDARFQGSVASVAWQAARRPRAAASADPAAGVGRRPWPLCPRESRLPGACSVARPGAGGASRVSGSKRLSVTRASSGRGRGRD